MPGRTDNPNRHRTQRQTRLAGLLAQRDQIAQTWAERFSHGLPGVGNLTVDLMVTEAALTDGWPHLADSWSGQWALADIRKLHDPDAGRYPGCSLCTRRAARRTT